MRDDPRENIDWLARELLAAERPGAAQGISDDTADLLAQVDHLLEDMQEPEPPAFAQKRRRQTKGEQAERSHISRQFDAEAAVLTKTKRQLRQEARQQKKSQVNNRIGGLVVLAVLECIGILYILGWWMQ